MPARIVAGGGLLVAATVVTAALVGPFLSQSEVPWDEIMAGRLFALVGIWAAAGALTLHARHVVGSRDAEGRTGDVLKELADFKAALDAASIVAITDADGIIMHANDRFCEISGYSREELIGRSHRIVNSGAHPREFFRDLWDTIAGGRVWRGEIMNRAKDGSTYWVDTTIVPFLDERGRPLRYIAIRNEVTERKLAQDRLSSQASLARLGEMAAVVAHEVRNPIAGIQGALQVLGRRLPGDSPDREIIGEMLTRLHALDDMVQDLLLFARPRPPKLAPLPLPPLLQECARVLAEDPMARGVEVDVRGDEPTVLADAGQLRAAVLNVLLNAAQAMGGRGRVEVDVTAGGREARVSIRDHGPGIPAELMQSVFEPFMTTKSRGTGLGLAIGRRVVEAHGGQLTARAADGGGAVLDLTLPLAQDPDGGGSGTAPPSSGQGGRTGPAPSERGRERAPGG